MTVDLEAGPSGLEDLQSAVAAFLADRGAPAPVRRDVHLALDEIISNSVRAAHPRHPSVTVDVSLTVGWLQLVIADDGEAFDLVAHPDPDVTADVLDRPVGGLGIYLVKRLMDTVQYERRDGVNRLTLGRRVPQGGPADVGFSTQ